jgi:D-sedoheptulose 7-phosphate isomerase
VEAARRARGRVITLSGFQPDNPLRRLGEVNFWVPSDSYGHVEITHLAICHSIVDTIMAGSH